MAATTYRAPTCLSCAPTMAGWSHSDPTHSIYFTLTSAKDFHQYSGRRFFPRYDPVSPAKKLVRGQRREVWKGKKIVCMYSGHATVVTATSWRPSVLNNELPVLVEFFATWCGPCKMVGRIIDEIAEEYNGKIRCYKVNADHYPQLANDHGIERVPTVLVLVNGEVLESITGTMPKYVYVGAIERSLCSS